MPPADAEIGVDRVSVSFPVKVKTDCDWTRSTVQPLPETTVSWSGKVSLGGGVEAFVGAQIRPGGWSFGKVEFNPSRVVDPDGARLCPPDQVVELIGHAVDAASQLMTPEVADRGDIRVKRLDVARDFSGVVRPAFFINGLRGMRRPWARRQFAYSDPQRGNAQTLCVGGKRSEARLYDKHQEAPERVPEGQVRWEVQARDEWLSRYGGITRLRDVTVENLQELAGNRWRWSAMGAEVTDGNRIIELVARSGESEATKRSFLGHLYMQAHGVVSDVSKETGAKYNRLQRELNIVLTPDTFKAGNGAGFVSRLDWESGREVVRVA